MIYNLQNCWENRILLHIHIVLQILDYDSKVIPSSKDLIMVFGVLNYIHSLT